MTESGPSLASPLCIRGDELTKYFLIFFFAVAGIGCAPVQFADDTNLSDLQELQVETSDISFTEINSGGGMAYSSAAGVWVESSIGTVVTAAPSISNADAELSLGFMAMLLN